MSSRHRRSRDRVGRYYDPTTGQFITLDPLVDETEQPYAYVGGDPVDEVDPDGASVGGACRTAACIAALAIGGAPTGANPAVDSLKDLEEMAADIIEADKKDEEGEIRPGITVETDPEDGWITIKVGPAPEPGDETGTASGDDPDVEEVPCIDSEVCIKEALKDYSAKLQAPGTGTPGIHLPGIYIPGSEFGTIDYSSFAERSRNLISVNTESLVQKGCQADDTEPPIE
jgi:hypothetical protein